MGQPRLRTSERKSSFVASDRHETSHLIVSLDKVVDDLLDTRLVRWEDLMGPRLNLSWEADGDVQSIRAKESASID